VFLVAHDHVDFQIMFIHTALEHGIPVIPLLHLSHDEIFHHRNLLGVEVVLSSSGFEGLIPTGLKAFHFPI